MADGAGNLKIYLSIVLDDPLDRPFARAAASVRVALIARGSDIESFCCQIDSRSETRAVATFSGAPRWAVSPPQAAALEAKLRAAFDKAMAGAA